MNDCKACAEIIGDCLVCQKLQDEVSDYKRERQPEGEHDPAL